jgi:hypothetical protein
MAKLEEEEEEEKEAGCSLNHTAKKGAHMYQHSVMSSSWPFGEVVHNSPKVASISLWDEPCFAHNSPIVVDIVRWDEPCVAARLQTP